jgi:hypothetical protein
LAAPTTDQPSLRKLNHGHANEEFNSNSWNGRASTT